MNKTKFTKILVLVKRRCKLGKVDRREWIWPEEV